MSTSGLDIVVVGAGAAGIPAALFAGAAGARVLLVDAAEIIGGTFHLSAGQMSAAGTRIAAAKGIADSAGQHFDDVMRISRGTADPALVRLAVDHAADTLHWLLDLGLVVEPGHPIIHHGHEPYRIARTYWAAEGGMAILKVLRPLVEAAQASGQVEVWTGTRLDCLLTDDAGGVCGVLLLRHGEPVDVHARAVILATGGYTADPALFAQLSAGRPRYGGGYAHALGQGLSAALALGGQARGQEHYLPTFAAVQDSQAPGGFTMATQTYPELRQPWEIYVDASGGRFMREDEPSVDERERLLLGLPDMSFWAVYDARIARDAPSFFLGGTPEEIARRFAASPAYVTSDSLGGLARAMGADHDRFVAAIDGYNQALRDGRPDLLGRLHCPLPVAEPPFYAVRHVGWSIVGFAGLTVDGRLRVLSGDGQPVAGLYAIGEILGMGATSGNAYVGGMSVTPAMTFGRLLGAELGTRLASDTMPSVQTTRVTWPVN